MTTGELIRYVRKEKGMTQKQVADACGMADSAIRKYESGVQTPKLETLRRIATALGVEWTELVPVEKQGTTVVAHFIENSGFTFIDKNGNVIKQGNRKPLQKMSDAEVYRAGILKFNSEEDRIAYFYKKLSDEGKLVAGGYFFRNLDKDAWSKVADYVMNLSENPLYQKESETPPKSPPLEDDDPTPENT